MTNWQDAFQILATPAWAPAGLALLRIVFIIGGAWLAGRIVSRIIRAFRLRIAAHMSQPEQVKRAETLGRACRYVASAVITLIAGILVLSELGISVAPILGAAGVVGLAIGFGAQSLVKDYFTGFFILLENQITRGDVVEVGGKGGLVEDVTLRYVRLRDYDGNVHYVPNGLISTVTNKSQDFAFAVVDVGVGYREDATDALQVMREVADLLCADSAYSQRMLAPVEIVGVERWDDSAVILRCRFKVRPLQQWDVRREYLKRLKAAFDERGIEIPFPHVTVYAGADKQGHATPFRLTQT